MATKIRHKRSAVAGKKPIVSQLESGELAINTADGKIFLLRDDNTVQDVTQRIFQNDTQVLVTDEADSSQATVSVQLNGTEQLSITEAGLNVKDNLDMENAKPVTFRELTASGEDGVSVKAPDTLPASYTLTLPLVNGTVGQVLATDGNGQLFFNDADIFGGNVIYVSEENGDDANDGQNAPVRTVKRACQIASGLVYNADGTINNKRVNIKVAVGDYTEQNPVIVPDNTVIKGDGLRGCIIRPANANQDMLRVRNACYFGEFTFRDGVDANFVPLITADYAVAFDDPFDNTVSRVGYTNLPNTRPTITTSPYVQNASIISFLGMNGAKIDGTKVQSPNVPLNAIEAENPVFGATPEQGKSMVANAFTHISFGGTGWRLTNDAYAQIVSCFQIFLLNGVYCQSGGYCSITNSATNFGLYALRSSGYSPKAFQFDRAFVTGTGEFEGKQSLTIVGINRETPVEEFVLRFREPEYKTAYTLLELHKNDIAQDTVDWINAQIAGASPSIWTSFQYNQDKCQRDVQLIVDALAYDIMFNSNVRTISAGLAYYRGNALDVIDNQKAQTIESLQYLKDVIVGDVFGSSGTAATRAQALMDELVDIIDNGTSAADAYSYPDPTGYNTSYLIGYGDARAQLIANKTFIQDEIDAWIAVQVASGIDPFSTGFTYDVAACRRDVGLIIDALIYDLTYGGNLQTYDAALAYFVGAVAQYGNGEKEETLAAYARLKTVIEEVIAETLVTKSAGNDSSQDTSGTPGSAESITFAGDRIDDITTYIDSNGAVTPTRIIPDISWVSLELQQAGNGLIADKIFISQRVIEYINTQIQSNLWYNFTYDQAKCYRDTQLIIDAVAQDTWDTGNRYSRSTGLAYYSKNLQDSTQISISGQELQTIAAIEQASVIAATYISDLDSDVRAFVDSRFDIIKTILNDPTDLPDPTEVSSEGDVTNFYKPAVTESTFDAAIQVNASTNVFTIVGHGFSNQEKVIYDPNGNEPIQGLDAEQNYFIKIINDDEFTLTFDESGDFDVDVIATSTGTHKFLSNVIEFFVEEVLNTHAVYQTLILESGAESYEFVSGRAITGTTGANNNSALVFSWEPAERRLVVSIEQVLVGSSLLRIQFDETSTITQDHALTPNTTISVNEASARTGLTTSTFTITATDGSSSLTNLGSIAEKQIWFHRPSVVNSSAHTWEYAGSGTDYNALPQNGGNTRAEFEQFEELPGRVYSSGTNELGDFKVGDFITAFNRTGNITFRNKVQVDELDALRLSLSDVAIEEISANVNLGDDEIGGSKDSRLPTQLAVRSFIANRLGGFVDKTVSTAAVPGAIVQLNTNGQLNPDLIPATRQFTSTNTRGYLSRLLQVDEIPAVDLKAGDIGTEEYEQVELTLDGNITADDGAVITQPGIEGAIGYAKGSYSSSGNILVASLGLEWIAGDDSTGDPWDVSVTAPNLFINGVDSGIKPTSKGLSSAITDNFFLKSSNTSQYLLLESDETYVFTSATLTNVARSSDISTYTTDTDHNLNVGNTVQVICTDDVTFTENGVVLSTPSNTTFTLSNPDPADPTVGSKSATGTVRTIVTSADGNAQGAVTEYREGIATNVDNANITGGSGYSPIGATEVYELVSLTSVTGTGTGAVADITVTAGQITDIDLRRGGTGYSVGDLLGVLASDVGGTGSGFQVEVTAIENRAYVNILGGELFVASASSIDFIEDNDAVLSKKTIALDNFISYNFLAGSSLAGGAVDYTLNRINVPNHGWTNGDPVTYTTLGNVPIGGMINNEVYYAKRIDDNTIELYEDYSLLNLVEFLTTPANNNHNLTRFTVNVVDNSILVLNHGLTTGDAIRVVLEADGSSNVEMFSVNGTEVVTGSRFFVGSVTTNSFTIHELRSDALSSINGLVTNARDIDGTGQGDVDVIPNNGQVSTVVNTSSRIKANWNSLAVTNIDASNIISGTISPSRLAATGVANTDTFLRGDSSYAVAVQTIAKQNSTDNPIVLTGSSLSGEFYGAVDIGIANTDLDPGGTFSTLGVSRFLQTQFDVNSDGSGEVFIKDGVIDAGTLDSLDSAFFLNPNNLSLPVPVSRGGTNITTYAVGDIIYASSTGTLNPLNIGRRNNFLKSNGTIPEWGTALDLSEGLDVGAAKITSSSTGAGSLYDTNVTSLDIGGAAENVKIGASTDARDITSFLQSFDATVSQDVAVNFGSIDQDTNDNVSNGEKEIPMADTTGILAGMIVTGSGNIPANTTVSGVTDEFIYLSVETTGTILSGTTLTFTYTPATLGIKNGDTVNIASSGITNLDGSWPVVGATFNATSFTVRTDANVTANVADPLDLALEVTKDNTMVIKNRRVTFGSAEASDAPVAATLRGEDAIGTDTPGGDFIIQAGIGTGSATGGDFIVKTGETSTTSDLRQTATTRLTIDTAGKAAFTGEVEVNDTISTTETTVGLLDDTATTINMGGAATTVEIGAATGTTTVHNNLDVDLDLNVDGGDITTNAATFNLVNTNATTVNFAGAGTTVSIGAGSGTTTVNNSLVVTGDLTVNGSTTTMNTTTISVDDKNIELGSVASPTDTTADGGGITLKGTTDKTLNWVNSNAAWTSSENFDLASGKVYRINNTSVLSSTTLGSGVVNSSLQTLGTINTGVWQGTVISPTYGGTGVNNGTKTITLGGNFTHSGAHTLGITTTGNTSVTFPTTGTLARTESPLSQFASTTSSQLAGVISDETGSGALVFGTSPTFTTGINAASTTMALFNTTATTVNFAGAATNIQIGAATGTTNINNNLDVDLDLNVDGGDITTNATTFNLINANATTVNFAKAATTLDIGAATGTTSINNSLDVDGDLNVDGGDITTNAATFNLLNTNATTINLGGGASAINIGAGTSTVTFADDITVTGAANLGSLNVSQINDTPIGNVTPNTGAFTTLTSSGLTTFTNNTASTSTSTGAVVITGGLGVGGAVYADSFSGDIDAANLTSGSVPNARITASNVTQHQASITGTGALNSGSITTGFGNINIGSSIFTGDASGLTNINASNIATGTVAGARLGGNQSMAGVKTFTDTSASNSTVSGAVIIAGGLGVGGTVNANAFAGNGASITAINASNISTGTIADGRLPTTQVGKTFSSDITAHSHKVGRGGGNSITNLAIAGGQSISSGTDNMIVGVGAGAGIITGNNNTALGNSALAALTSATHNTAVGNDSQAQRTTAGNFNTSVGAQSMANSTGGSSNVAVGYQALELTTGNNNIGIGTLAGDSLTTGSNNIIIGYNAQPTAVNTSNEITIGTATQTNMRIPGVNLTISTTTLNFTGTTGFAGVGTSLTALNASQLTSGTVPDARISQTSVTQHQAAITGTGALASGSITSGFGSIDIGADNLTATGTVSLGATSFNDNNITNVGSIALDTISGDNGSSMNFASSTIVNIDNTTESSATTSGALIVDGGVGIAKALRVGGTIHGDGSGLTALNASNLSSGTVANARISGSYTNITGTGALNAGSITSGFGDINIGTSTFTGNGSGLSSVNADTLDSIDSGSFLRSDADDTATGLITVSRTGEMMRFADTSASGSPYIAFAQGATRRGYIQMVNGGTLRLASDVTGERLDLGSGLNGLTWFDNGTATAYTVWHSGNDGTGSGLDADTLDGVNSGSFLRSDTNDSFSGTLTGAGSINITGTIQATSFTGDGSGITGVVASDANTLDSLDSSQFLRSDTADQKTSGTLRFNDNVLLTLGTGDDFRLSHNGSTNLIDLIVGDLLVRDNTTTRFTFARTTGNFTASGEVTAFSDARLKDNIEVIADPLTKILSIRGVTFTRTDQGDTERKHMGVIAQEVEQYFPEVVHTTEDGIKTVNYGAMAGAFIEAFKDQQKQIDELRAMVEKLLDK
jgi:hypothetical protein